MEKAHFIKKIENFIISHGFPASGATIIATVSGGADSVALLLLLHERGIRITAAHCNFHLRGAESDRDETFVRQLCEGLGVPLHVQHFDTAGEAEQTGESIEMAARRLQAQPPQAELEKRVDFILNNDGTPDQLAQKVEALLKKL